MIWTSITILTFCFGAIGLVLYKQNTTTPSLGHNNGLLTPTPSTPNAVSSQSDDPRKKVEPLPFKADLHTTMTALTNSVESYEGAHIIKQDANYLYVIFTSKRLKFNDDVEFYLNEDQRLVH